MRDCMIGCVVLLAIAGTAHSDAPGPSAQGKALQESRAAGAAKGPRKELIVDLGGRVKMELILIPAGTFMMGDEKGPPFAKPAHKVTISKAFHLGKYEVTQEQWQAVMGSNPSEFKGPKNPVERVSWQDCQAFLAKLNEKSRSGGRFQLPSDAQWEYACRAGTTTQYCFGDDPAKLEDYAWWVENAAGAAQGVGQKKPNAWGLYDMHGNVWEWCADWYERDYYATSPADDPRGPKTGWDRVIRGGGWCHTARRCWSAYRSRLAPMDKVSYVGIRVAFSP